MAYKIGNINQFTILTFDFMVYSRMWNKCLLSVMLFFFPLFAEAQHTENYPKNYFRNPLDIPILLAGNFGECRPNHFHTGIDLKTNGKENLKVYAAAEGYVSRISISHSGYGNALYITHPNGYTTVYGHLNDFYPALQDYLVQQQYAKESWNINLHLEPGQFPVTKGQFIAFSGTTGGSTGPHLHFEIRDAKTEHVLNAALFGLPFKDTRPPVPYSVALYGPQSIYVQNPVLLTLKKEGNAYVMPSTKITTPESKLRIAVLADDFMEGSHNTLGIYETKLFMDDKLQAAWRLNDIDFDQNRYVNAFADYRLKEQNKGWYQKLFRVPGNRLEAYTFLNSENGLLDISDGQLHTIRIELTDAAGNTSYIRFSIISTNQPLAAPCTELWRAGKENVLSVPTLFFKVDSLAFYDDFCFSYTETPASGYYSAVVQLGDNKIPLHRFSELRIKLNKLVSFDLRNKLVFVHQIRATRLPGNHPQNAVPARYDKGWACADIRTFGNYYVTIDTTGPVIRSLQKNTDLSAAREIRFEIKDNFTSVKNFRAELNGKWLRFVRAGNIYTYTFDKYCPKGKNKLIITAGDENDNLTTYTFNFIR